MYIKEGWICALMVKYNGSWSIGIVQPGLLNSFFISISLNVFQYHYYSRLSKPSPQACQLVKFMVPVFNFFFEKFNYISSFLVLRMDIQIHTHTHKNPTKVHVLFVRGGGGGHSQMPHRFPIVEYRERVFLGKWGVVGAKIRKLRCLVESWNFGPKQG